MSHVTTAERLTCYAVAAPGLELLVARELQALARQFGVQILDTEPGGVEFQTDPAGLCAVQLHLRVASRVLVRLGSFHAAAFGELERHALRLPWTEFVPPGRDVAFRVTSRKSRLYHQDAIAERLRAAAGVALGEARRRRPTARRRSSWCACSGTSVR